MAAILPRDLPAAGTVNPNAALITDDGTTVQKATPLNLVDAAIPLVSQAEAEAGADNVKRTTALRVKQAVDAQIKGPLAASSGSTLVNFTMGTTGAVSEALETSMRRIGVYPEQFGAVGDGVADDTVPLRRAGERAIQLKAPVLGRPGATYRTTGPWEPTAGLTIIGNGATIQPATQFAVLTVKSNTRVSGLNIVGPGAAYDAGGRGIYGSGTRNGPGVAPTYLVGVVIEDCNITGFGNSGVEFRYARRIRVNRTSAGSVVWHGFLFFSCRDVIVDGFDVDGVSGSSETTWNAYALTFTADTVSTDRVRDPVSKDCVGRNGTVRNIPTWHALDTHGGDNCGFENIVLTDCRGGAAITNLNDVSARYCFIRNVRSSNFYGAGETNGNGTFKRSIAFWIAGIDNSKPAIGCTIEACYSFGHGSPDSTGGAYYQQYTDASTLLLNNTDVASYNVGVCGDGGAKGLIRGHTTTNVRGTGAGPSLKPTAIYVTSADYQNLDIEGCTLIRSDAALDVDVAHFGITLAAGTANRTVRLKGNDMEQASVSATNFLGALTGYSGDYSLDVTFTATGVSGSVTGIGKAFRRSGRVTLNLPAITGTSNATSFTLTGLFANFTPPVARNVTGLFATNNGTDGLAAAQIEDTGVITLLNGAAAAASGWANTGTKGLKATTLTYEVLAQ